MLKKLYLTDYVFNHQFQGHWVFQQNKYFPLIGKFKTLIQYSPRTEEAHLDDTIETSNSLIKKLREN